MGGGKKKDDEPIRVTDRRASADTSAPHTTTPEPDDSAAAQTAYAASEPKAAAAAAGQYPPIDFNTFVLSMSTSALVHLGEDLLSEGSAEVNLPLARQTIDLLGILESKTKGNLTGEEERLLSQVLYDLRLRYVSISKKR